MRAYEGHLYAKLPKVHSLRSVIKHRSTKAVRVAGLECRGLKNRRPESEKSRLDLNATESRKEMVPGATFAGTSAESSVIRLEILRPDFLDSPSRIMWLPVRFGRGRLEKYENLERKADDGDFHGTVRAKSLGKYLISASRSSGKRSGNPSLRDRSTRPMSSPRYGTRRSKRRTLSSWNHLFPYGCSAGNGIDLIQSQSLAWNRETLTEDREREMGIGSRKNIAPLRYKTPTSVR